jgi:anti-anti-sigma factor
MGQSPSRWFDSEDAGNVTIVRLTRAKTLDEPTSEALGVELHQLAEKMGGRTLLLNFAEVTYLASGALAMLLTLNKKLRDVRGKLVLSNIDAKLYEVFEITKLNQILEIIKGPAAPPGGPA